MGFEWRGMDEFRAAFSRLKDDGPGKLDEAVRGHLEETVLPITQERVPRLTGALAATGRVEEGPEDHEFSLWYGDSEGEADPPAVDYAAAVHEREDVTHLPPTGTKFVEEPLKESVPELEERAARALEDLARG